MTTTSEFVAREFLEQESLRIHASLPSPILQFY
jgi:hypothetical protein